MTTGELFFLLFGASIGVVAGAALLDVIRAHPTRPEVRLTVTHNALPLRLVRPDTPGEPITLRRTVRGPGLVTTEPAPDLAPDLGYAAHRSRGPRVAVPVADGVDPMLAAFRSLDIQPAHPIGRSRHEPSGPTAFLERPGASVAVAEARPRAGSVAVAERPVAMAPANESARDANAAALAAESDQAAAPTDPCASHRQLASERCAVATQARAHAEHAAAEARDARRAYDAAVQEAEAATHEADPRTIAGAKEAARRAFREATAGARERHHQEIAATVWLTEINRINQDRRAALTRAAAAERRMQGLLATIEALTLAADAARITAETASAACNDARGALAVCEEAGSAGLAADRIAPPADRREDDAPIGEEDDARRVLRVAGRQPAIYRLLEGDGQTMTRIVAAATGSPEARRQLQLDLSGLVDAIVAGAIEQAFLDFPSSHRFWGGLARIESREVAVGLAGLGYRFDGLGGFDGGRVPSARDLSLAVGYAGLDPRRIRQWPTEAESRDLYRGVSVAADEYLASMAPELSLGELVALLGRRSEALADLWNQWGHVRPLLMATAG